MPESKIKKKKGFFAKFWNAPITEQADPFLEPRFIAFEEGHILVMQYMPEMVTRDFGVFSAKEKPLP